MQSNCPQPTLIAGEANMFDKPAGTDHASVGQALRSARKRADLSTSDAARLAGISTPLLSLIERGEHPLTSVSTRNLARLHLAFGLSWAEFVALILPVYGSQLPYLSAGRPVSSRFLHAPGTVKTGLNPVCKNTLVPQTIAVPDYAAIAAYPDSDLMVLHVTPDSLGCDEAMNAVPVDCYAIFNTALTPRNGDVVAVWLEKEECGALQIWTQDGKAVVLNSYDRRERPVITDRPGAVRGVYVGHLSSGRRAQTPERMQH